MSVLNVSESSPFGSVNYKNNKKAVVFYLLFHGIFQKICDHVD